MDAHTVLEDEIGVNDRTPQQDYKIHPCDYDSDSEQSSDEFVGENMHKLELYYVGKDGTAWKKYPLSSGCKIFSEDLLSTTEISSNVKTELECFSKIIDDEIIELLVKYTNLYIGKIKDTYKRNRDANFTNDVEIKALIGILYLVGTMKSRNMNIKKFWDTSNLGVEAIYVTMSLGRFQFLLRCLSFDDDMQRKGDKLEAVRELLDAFLLKSQNALTPGEYMTIDENYVECEKTCTFLHYIPLKPNKFGIKINTLIDVRSLYTYNLEIFTGKQPPGPHRQCNSKKSTVKRLIQPIKGVSRNLTMDHRFTSIPLALDLLKNYNISIVGTINKHNIEIPPDFTKPRDVHSTIYGFSEQCTIVSYIPKKKKCILGVSTMHNGQNFSLANKHYIRPEILTFYDKTKYASDLLDQMCSAYDVAVGLQRWPLAIFFHILNLAAINALVIFEENSKDTKAIRHEFLRALAIGLMKPQIVKRVNMAALPFEIKMRGRLFLKMKSVLRIKERGTAPDKCYLCRKTSNASEVCSTCDHSVCSGHSYVLCANCAYNADTKNSTD